MAQIIPQSNFASRLGSGLGSGFGQGLADQLPQEMNRSRLSKGLDQIGKDKTLTPYQQAARMYGLPGGAEAAPNLIPLIRQSNVAEEYIQQNRESSQAQSGQGSQQAQPQQAAPNELGAQRVSKPSEGYKTILTPESTNILQEVIAPPSRDEIRQAAREYLLTQPARFDGNADKAEAQAEADLTKRYQAKLAEQNAAKAQMAFKDKFDQDFGSYLSTQVQKEGEQVYSDIPGDLLTQVRAQAEDEVASKKLSKEQAIKKYGDKLLDYAKKKQSLRNIGSSWMFNKDSKENIQSLNNIRKTFKEFGREKELRDLLESNWNLNPLNASYLAKPISDNKNLSKWLDNQKKLTGLEQSIGKSGFIENFVSEITGVKGTKSRDKMLADSVKSLAEVISPEDSVLSISKAMESKGYDSQNYFRAIQKAWENDEIILSKSQQDEFDKQVNRFPTLDDFFYFGMLGLSDPLETK